MSLSRDRFRRLTPAVAALLTITAMFLIARLPSASADQRRQIASAHKFESMPIDMPPGYTPLQTIRQVNPAYQKIQAWISSIGANIAIGDLTGHGLADSMCIVDPRTDQTVITYTPTAPAADRFTPFELNPGPLPMDKQMAPTGCAFGDFVGNGRQDVLVTFMGRTPILYLAKSDATGVKASAYKPIELVPEVSVDGLYHGPRWQTTSINVADYDGTGHPDVFIGNYFPDSDVLDASGLNNVQMNQSMSSARNGGGDHILAWHDATSGPDPTVGYVEQRAALPFHDSTGWTLAIANADLTGDGLPDLYVANDFGNGHLFHNVSTPGHIMFTTAIGGRTPTTPKSFVLGNGSFKGMGVAFADLDNNGRFDAVVSNIAVAYGLEESNFVWVNQAPSGSAMKTDLSRGYAPFVQKAQEYGMAWNGWSWDVKAADFLNSGKDDVVFTDGFVKGNITRWPWLQELAMTNDDLLSNPAMWPNAQVGDDIAGHETLGFFAPAPGGSYTNVATDLGLAIPTPSRGLAVSDTTGTGAQDFAVAYQWAPSVFYANKSPNLGHYLGLQLYRPTNDPAAVPGQGLESLYGSTAYDATVQISYNGKTQINQLDGGSGHAGHSSFEVYFGLGGYSGPVSAHIEWRDVHGVLHNQTVSLTPGSHNLLLTNSVQEVSGK
jgi:hypothetical protein